MVGEQLAKFYFVGGCIFFNTDGGVYRAVACKEGGGGVPPPEFCLNPR